MMEQNLSCIEKLIYDLYYSSEGHSSANKQLTAYQTSKESWDFCWALLQPCKPLEVQYFGASCLHLKVSKYWSELDSNEKKDQIRGRLLETLCKYINDGKMRIVQTRLCVALASYIVHSITNHWPTAVVDLIENFQSVHLPNVPPNKIAQTLLEILTLIPEEFTSNMFTMHDRNCVRSRLAESTNTVFQVLQTVLSQHDLSVEVKQLAVKCFSNWSQSIGPLIGDMHEPILIQILSAMSDEDLLAPCVEAINTIYSNHDIHKYPNTVLKLIERIVKLEDMLNVSLKEQQSHIYSTLFNLFIHIGESHSRLLLESIITKEEYRESILKLITFVLQCSATNGYYPVDETCSEQAFNFWYTLQDDIIGSDQDKVTTYLALFNPLYQSLIDTLLVKVQYPPENVYEQEWTNDDKEGFRCYRQDIGDTFMYCYNMLRSSMLSTLMNHFQLAINHLNGSGNVPEARPWQHLEAVIFAFSSISENIDIMEDIYISQLFESLSMISVDQINAPRLTASIMEMFGSYYEWIYNHANFLPSVLRLLVVGLKSEQIAVVSATMALKDITRECQPLIFPYANDLLVACEECLRPGSSLKPKEKSRLMCTVGQVLAVMPYDVTMNFLNVILPPLLEDLQRSMNTTPTPSTVFVVRNDLVSQINMLTMLFATLDPELKQIDPEESDNIRLKDKISKQQTHPSFPIFKEVLPLLVNITMKWSHDETVIDAVSDCIKKALSNLLDHVRSLVMDILHLIHNVYSSSFQPSLLDVLKLVMILYSPDQEMRTVLFPFYKQICALTVQQCHDLKQSSSLIEYFFTVAALIMKKVPEIYAENSNQDNIELLAMFRLAASSLVLNEKPTVRAAASFLTEFINKSRDRDSTAMIVNSEGEFLVVQVFSVIGGAYDSPRNNVELMADVLLALNQKYFDNFGRWLQSVTAKPGFPTDRITKEQKDNFNKILLRERRNKRKLKETLTSLALVCRGLVDTEYAQQQFKLPF